MWERGWETEPFTLRANVTRKEGEAPLLASVGRASVIFLVFPLYGDALPYLATKALAVIAAGRREAGNPHPQSLVAIVNSGFPEIQQSAVAMAICQEFAAQTGISWRGGLVLPGGGFVGEEPLGETKRSGPPVRHVVRALDLTAASVAEGRPVPAEAVQLMGQNPIPFVPFRLWRRLYLHLGGKGFVQMAAKNGIGIERLREQPYAV
jgi:hypothetical protein